VAWVPVDDGDAAAVAWVPVDDGDDDAATEMYLQVYDQAFLRWKMHLDGNPLNYGVANFRENVCAVEMLLRLTQLLQTRIGRQL
jgi:hypothetical protein